MTNEEFIKSVSLEGEEWRDVVGFEGLYMVSSYGRIISLKRTVKNRYSERVINPSIMNPQMNNKGYYNIILRNKGNIQHFLIHRLVAIHFVCNNFHYDEIDHIDGNKANNHFNNLQWCNRVSNMRNKNTKEKLSQNASKRINEKNWKSKPIVGVSINNSDDILFFKSMCDAKRNGFNQGAISAVCLHKRKTHKNYTWMFLSDYETLINKSKNSSPNG